MRVVILDPPLHEIFVEFTAVSRVLHEQVPHFFLKVIRLSSLHKKTFFPWRSTWATPAAQYDSKSDQKTSYLMFGGKCKKEMNAGGKFWKMSRMGVVTHLQTARVVTVTPVAKS